MANRIGVLQMAMLEKLKSRWRSATYAREVDVHTYKHDAWDGEDLDGWIRSGIVGYQQWYQHVDFGDGIEAHVTAPPNWVPDSSRDEGAGLDRWNLIIRRNLPDVSGLRVLDLGCNVGLYSLELARLGAREVVGVDRDISIRQRTGQLPRVDLVSQANFVRDAFELREDRAFPIVFKAIDFQNLRALESLGQFDLIVALNVVYHELERAPALVQTLGRMTSDLVLQSSIAHPSPIREWATPSATVDMLTDAGFDRIFVDCPQGYLQPVVRGIRTEFDSIRPPGL
jgi:2-polyprenyl-3-methyl-5-hydroxy-6-metoxy-1,4-benzoquinol methylase